MHAIGGAAGDVTAREHDDLYAKVIEIAQEQAQASTAMAELHRQNVTKIETMTALLSAQTTSIVGISATLQQLTAAYDRAHHEIKESHESVQKHVTSEFKQREFKYWLALSVVALLGSSDGILKLVGILKP